MGEVIRSLERVLAISPGNQNARASLDWARERQRRENETRQLSHARPQGLVPAAQHDGVPASPPQPALLQLASLAYLLVGLLWLAPAMMPLLDDSLALAYQRAGILPLMKLPYLPSSSLGAAGESIPEFNLLYLVPLTIALLSFVATENLWDGRRVVSLYLAAVAALSIGSTVLFVAGQAASVALVASSAMAGACALTGRAMLRRF